ncbi:porin family protein [Caminibacter mediatlanticus]|uniref:Autotransporter outer membrane beta-barrel domain-containing protein n=1 Tax=Caminibacter mediatlanticus TB-2 TaxID=391592 RepID=A0AAI9AG82_9BACT|nr:porin family protein [Caminibacter mediatlanticus]EDM22934.1 hypothetical protein CMTB2_05497 [Caminibacter mediatlanticus TB-2]
MKKILSIAGIVAIMATGASALGLNAKVDYLNVNSNKVQVDSIATYNLTIKNKNVYLNGWSDSFSTNKLLGTYNNDLTSYGINAGMNYKNYNLSIGYQYEKIEISSPTYYYDDDIDFYSVLGGVNLNNLNFKLGGIFGSDSDTNIYVAKATYTMPIQNNLSIQPSIWIEKNDKKIGDKTNDKTNFNAALTVNYAVNNLNIKVGAKAGWEKAKITNTITVMPFYEEGNSGFANVDYKLNTKLTLLAGLKVGEINSVDKNTLESKTATATTLSLGVNYNF